MKEIELVLKELGGKPGCRITELPDGKAQLVFDIKASIGRNNAFTGHFFLKVVVDPSDKTLHDAACKLKLEPSKFSARDEMPASMPTTTIRPARRRWILTASTQSTATAA